MSSSEWPADKVERRPVADLIANARNARTHSEEQIEQIAAAIKEWGWTTPVLVDEANVIIAGHGRILAAVRLGITDVPVMVSHGWTEAQKRAYMIADNQIALNSGWDESVLAVEFGELKQFDFALELTGFSMEAIESFHVDKAEGGGASTGGGAATEARKTLLERFGIAPFSVMSARGGWWQDRKRAWLALGIDSEVGRGENLLRFSDTINEPDPEKRAAKKGRRPNAEPAGGGGGGWKAMNEKMAANREKRRNQANGGA